MLLYTFLKRWLEHTLTVSYLVPIKKARHKYFCLRKGRFYLKMSGWGREISLLKTFLPLVRGFQLAGKNETPAQEDHQHFPWSKGGDCVCVSLQDWGGSSGFALSHTPSPGCFTSLAPPKEWPCYLGLSSATWMWHLDLLRPQGGSAEPSSGNEHQSKEVAEMHCLENLSHFKVEILLRKKFL